MRNTKELNIYPVTEYNKNKNGAIDQLKLNKIREYIRMYFKNIFVKEFKEETRNLNRLEIKQGIMKNKRMLLFYKLSKLPILVGKIRIDVSGLSVRIHVPISSIKEN